MSSEYFRAFNGHLANVLRTLLGLMTGIIALECLSIALDHLLVRLRMVPPLPPSYDGGLQTWSSRKLVESTTPPTSRSVQSSTARIPPAPPIRQNNDVEQTILSFNRPTISGSYITLPHLAPPHQTPPHLVAQSHSPSPRLTPPLLASSSVSRSPKFDKKLEVVMSFHLPSFSETIV